MDADEHGYLKNTHLQENWRVMLNYNKVGEVAVLGLDDDKANAVGYDFVNAVNKGLDKALDEAKCVLLTGRPGVFSGGFDLKELAKGSAATAALIARGAALLLRIFRHPQPVVIACTGHAVAAGALMLLAADTRIGTAGNFRIGLNETAIGMTLPVFGIQLAMARLSPCFQTKAAVQGQMFNPDDAQQAGFLDAVTVAEALYQTALSEATQLADLPANAYVANKLAMRQPYIQAIEASLEGAQKS